MQTLTHTEGDEGEDGLWSHECRALLFWKGALWKCGRSMLCPVSTFKNAMGGGKEVGKDVMFCIPNSKTSGILGCRRMRLLQPELK